MQMQIKVIYGGAIARWAAHDGQASGSTVSHDALDAEKRDRRQGEEREREQERRLDHIEMQRGNHHCDLKRVSIYCL